MAFNLRNRHFLKLLDFSPEEIGFLLATVGGPQEGQVRGTRATAPDRARTSP